MGNIQWSRIKNSIKLYCKNAFAEQNIAILETDINDAIDIFYNLLSKKIPYAMLNGLGRTVLPALQESCCDNPGSLSSFLVIKAQVDSIMKILLITTGKKTYAEVTGKGTKQLFVWTGIVPSYTMQDPHITLAIAETYKGRSDGLYLFAYTDYCRNELHESPDIDASVVTYGLKHILAFYIFMIYMLKSDLLSLHPEYAEKSYTQISDPKGERMYYDFMNYGQAANAIKNRFINSFVLETLYSSNTEKSKLIEKMLIFSKNSLKQASAERILERLKGNNRIVITPSFQVCLSDEERNRLGDAYSNYAERINDFLNQLDSFISMYSLTCERSTLFDVVKTFFENNFNTDLIEISDNIEIEETNELHILTDKLKKYGCADNSIKNAIISLLQICKSNDILVRLGMSKLYSKISNPDAFEQYANSPNRKVYVDTQLVLYGLCVNMDLGSSDNKRFVSMKNLLSTISNKDNIQLTMCRHYLSEVSYHLRQALLLIPFADRYDIYKREISSNVFYRYYYELREKNMLSEDINSFADFLYDVFGFEESDAYSSSFWESSTSVLEDIIYNDLGVTIERIPMYGEDQINRAANVFKSLFTESKSKSDLILKNDAIMGIHLFATPIEEAEPFFLTWDSMFSPFRKKYIQSYKKTKHIYWHLFSPMKFVNHIDLLNLHVDIDSLSDDMLTMIETDEYKNHTSRIIDKFSKILDISGIDATKRRKYINMINEEVFNEQDFPNIIEAESDELQSEIKKIADLFEKLLDHYKEISVDSLATYTKYVLNEEFFQSLVTLIKETANKGTDDMTMNKFYEKIDNLSREMFENEKID